MHSISEFTNRVIHGGCVKVLGDMPDRRVDLVLTDPPSAARYCLVPVNYLQ